jgi:Ala-tRNA(Pro) deacylase
MYVAKFLADKHVAFQICKHSTAFTTAGLAESMHMDCGKLAKTVLLRVNGGFKYLLAVLPGTYVVDLEKLSHALGGTHVELATKAEVAERCPDCDPGVLPPFGTQYNLETLVDPAVEATEEFVFEGNRRDEAVRMRYRDFYDLEHPLVAEFAVPAEAAKPVAAHH